MNDIIKEVKTKYPEVHIDKQTCPSYVKMYLKDASQIVMVYAEGELKSSTKVVRYNSADKKEELDLTGSPLKVDLSMHSLLDDTFVYDIPKLWSKEEETHEPIDIKKAREITNFYNKVFKASDNEKSIPLWILTNPSSPGKPLLLTLQSEKEHFARGIVTYEDAKTLNEVNVYKLVKYFTELEGIEENMVTTSIECKYHISGLSYITVHEDDLSNAAHSGLSELACEWATMSFEPDLLSCKVNMIQEVIVGHVSSPCNALWGSVCALQNLHQLVIEMNELGPFSVDLKTAVIRNKTTSTSKPDNSKRLKNLLNETEEYAYATECPTGGCTAVTEDTTSLRQALQAMSTNGSSNDFTYKLWDILRDSETAEELIILLIQTLKFFSSSNIHPFIDGSNKTFLSKMVLKLARGHSQAAKFIKNLHSNPLQALSLVTQLGVEKTMWEYTKVMSLLDHSYAITAIWNGEVRSSESIEQINQTLQEMSMSGGDFTMNPFESLMGSEMSIRIDCDSFYEDPEASDDLPSKKPIKNHGLVNDKKDSNEVPLIADDIDISLWKNLLLKFAQVHVCLEHLYRAETSLRLDFSSLKPIASQLLDVYGSNKSPVKSVTNLCKVPVRKFSMTIANNDVLYHLKKPALWYRLEICRSPKAREVGTYRDSKLVYVLSQHAVFPPAVWQNLETQIEEITTMDTMGIELKYHCTKYAFVSTQLTKQIKLS